MSLKKFFVFTYLLFSFYCINAQRANTWYFGNNAGLNFNTTTPTALTNGLTANADNTSTISDLNGNLLFYTNGISVWNKNHLIMPNGGGLVGSFTAGQCALIVPVPCSQNKYVIFHVTDYVAPGNLNYTVVDMSLNFGLGDVVVGQKNISLGTGWTEKLCAYYNPIGNFYWVFSHKWSSDQFVAFKVDNSSIASQSVISSIGSIHNCGTYSGVHDAMGQLTISPDGTKLVNALTCQNKFELFDLNINTGVLSNSISIPGNVGGGSAWGTAFSPDSKKLYVNSIFGQSVFQYDLNTYTQSAIVASKYTLYTSGSNGYNFGYMELGPDNKVYIAKPSASNITVINSPNSYGAACNFSLLGPSISPKTSSHGLSRIAYNIPNGSGSSPVIASTGSLSCINPITQLSVLSNSLTSNILWSGPGIIGANNTPTINVNNAGIYTVSVSGPNACENGTVTFNVLSSLGPLTLNTSQSSMQICSSISSATLSVTGATNYTWTPSASLVPSTGSIVVASPGSTTAYTVNGSTGVCFGSAILTLSVNATPTIIANGNSPICSGKSSTLSANGAASYTWIPGNLIGLNVVVNPLTTSIYTVIGSSTEGCISKSFVSIKVNPTPTLIAVSSTTLSWCEKSFSLNVNGATNYTWMPINLTGNSVVTTATNSNNTYTVIGESGGCYGEATLSVLVIDCDNSIFGITKAASKPVLINNSFHDVTFTITAVNASSLNLTNVSLNEDLNATFPFPTTYTIINQPLITSQYSNLTVNPLFDGGSQISLTAPSTSTLLANKRDTIIFTLRIDAKGYFGPFKNSVVGFADKSVNITLADSSNNGFAWDPDSDGDPTNNDIPTIFNLPFFYLFIPEGFTPDGDGKNDVFYIKGLNGRPVKLTIFNRWGNKVYEKSDYDNSWNGYVNTSAITLGSNKVPAATYYYIIEFLDGDKETRTGFVVVQY